MRAEREASALVGGLAAAMINKMTRIAVETIGRAGLIRDLWKDIGRSR
jgi:hypothetical protein